MADSSKPDVAQVGGNHADNPGEISDGYHTFNELYEFRLLYNAALFNEWAKNGLYDVHLSFKHSDGEYCFGGGWFVVVAELPTGQITNHYEQKDIGLFNNVDQREMAAKWDGHTAADVATRLRSFIEDKSWKLKKPVLIHKDGSASYLTEKTLNYLESNREEMIK